jgi:hypothetical protein
LEKGTRREPEATAPGETTERDNYNIL